MATTVARVRSETLRTLPDDNVRQILWRFAERYDLQMLVQSAREVARGPVARLVAQGLKPKDLSARPHPKQSHPSPKIKQAGRLLHLPAVYRTYFVFSSAPIKSASASSSRPEGTA